MNSANRELVTSKSATSNQSACWCSIVYSIMLVLAWEFERVFRSYISHNNFFPLLVPIQNQPLPKFQSSNQLHNKSPLPHPTISTLLTISGTISVLSAVSEVACWQTKYKRLRQAYSTKQNITATTFIYVYMYSITNHYNIHNKLPLLFHRKQLQHLFNNNNINYNYPTTKYYNYSTSSPTITSIPTPNNNSTKPN